LRKLLENYAGQAFDFLDKSEEGFVKSAASLFRNIGYISGSKDIFNKYMKSRDNVLKDRLRKSIARLEMRNDIQKHKKKKTPIFSGKLTDTVEIKRNLYRFLEQVLTNLSFSQNLGVQNGFDIIDAAKARGILSDKTADMFKKCYSFINGLRLKEQKIRMAQGNALPANIAAYEAQKKELDDKYAAIKLQHDEYVAQGKSFAELAPLTSEMNQILSDLKKLYKQKPELDDAILDPETIEALNNTILPQMNEIFNMADDFFVKKNEQAFSK
ncbi:MAG: putative nucleotidyltransferase substrate binding domain-containing protein, partial [Bacteroidota bacterium]